MNILVVDDDRDFAESLAEVLEIGGHQTTTVFTGEAALALEKTFEPDVALVDIRLGRESGLDLVADLKERRPDVDCILVTAHADLDTAIEAVRRGAYDYLRKPVNEAELVASLERCFEKRRLEREKESYSSAELLARIESVLRPTSGPPTSSRRASPKKEIARFGGWNLDLTGRKLFSLGNEEVTLTSSEFDLLVAFVTHPDQVLSRLELLGLVGREGTHVSSVNVQVMRLRRKIEDDPMAPRFIKAIRSAGYIFATRVDWD
jgi:DNA-binding response OmpR family regulator